MVKRKVLVTAALPYANGAPHLGHGRSTYLPADIFTRFLRMTGADVVYVCATDWHGTPILINAEKEGKKPEEYANAWHNYFDNIFKKFGMSFDIFYKTHSPENKKMATEFFERACRNGYIYEKTIKENYCENDKKFLPDRYVIGTCPYCKAEDQYSDYCENCGKAFVAGEVLNPKCKICGTKPLIRESSHCFFALNALKKEVSDYLNYNNELQSEVKNYVKQWLKNDLQDWDITRDLGWGFEVPGKKGQVFYVWWDAPIGYISSTIKLAQEKKQDWTGWWKSKKTEIYHFIGKDIVYHHYLFWPAMLLSVKDNYTMPKAIPTRGYLNLEGRKFSKSRGWYISLEDFLKVFPADYLRFYLTMITPNAPTDANFSLEEFKKRVNDDLIANFGNLARRTLYFIEDSFKGKVPEPKKLDSTDKELISLVSKNHEAVTKLLNEVELMKALQLVLSSSSAVNTYFQSKEPWKTKDPNCLYVAVNMIKGLCIELSPFIPNSMQELWEGMGLKGKAAEQDWVKAFDLTIKAGQVIKSSKPLFNQVSDDSLKKFELKDSNAGLIDIDDFRRSQLRVAKVLKAERLNDKLLKIRVLADKERSIVAGIGKHYKPEELVGKKVIVVINLKPKMIAGVASEGMILAAEKGDKLTVLTTMSDVPENSEIL